MSEEMTLEECKAALKENVRLGYMRITGKDKDGEDIFEVTPEGIRRAELMGATLELVPSAPQPGPSEGDGK